MNRDIVLREWVRATTTLGGSLDDRLAADYDIGTSFTSDEAERQCRSAMEFVGRIRRYLVDNGFADADLGSEGGDG